MTACLVVKPGIAIDRDELKFTFVRSSGPGGQNVNKVNSKAVLRWTVAETEGLSENVRLRFVAKYRRRISQQGELVLTSQRYRDQHRNVVDCLERLRSMITSVVAPPKTRKTTRPSKRAVERRLEAKRQLSSKKQNRGYQPDSE